MKKILQAVLLLILIATSCKQKVESKNEKFSEISQIEDDSIKSVELRKSKTDKQISDYITIQKPVIVKSDYINFFNDVLNPNSLVVNEHIKIFPMDSKYFDSYLNTLTEKSKDSSISELIDRNDVKFIYEQTKAQKDFIIEVKNISRMKVDREYLDNLMNKYEDIDVYWNEVYKLGRGYYRLELPLFSIDKTIAFFRYSYSCGSLCANSGTYIYKRINGKWERIGTIGIEIVS